MVLHNSADSWRWGEGRVSRVSEESIVIVLYTAFHHKFCYIEFCQADIVAPNNEGVQRDYSN